MEGFTAQHASVFLTKERILAQKSIGKKGLTNSETISFVKKNKKIKKRIVFQIPRDKFPRNRTAVGSGHFASGVFFL